MLIVCDLVCLSTGYVRIAEKLKHLVVEEGERAKFLCKVSVHPQDVKRLIVTWRFESRLLNSRDSDHVVLKQEGLKFSLVVSKAKTTDSGVYTCVASLDLETDVSSAHLQIRSRLTV